jgi:hypothetical protein
MLADTNLNEMRRHDVMELARIPGYIGTFTLDTSTVMGQYKTRWPSVPNLAHIVEPGGLDDNIAYPTFCAYISQFFSNFKGGMKYCFEFVTNDFTAARVRFWHLPCDHATSTPDDFSGSAVTREVPVRGVTIITLLVPKDDRDVAEVIGGYCDPFAADADKALAVPALERTPHLALDLVGAVTVSEPGNIASIDVNVYAAAAEDMDFINYQGHNLRPPSVPVEEAADATVMFRPLRNLRKEAKGDNQKKSLVTLFKKPFEPLGESKALVEAGLVSNESTSTVEALLKRYERYHNVNGPLQAMGCNVLYSNVQSRTLHAWAELFMFWRGSINFKMLTAGNGWPHALQHYPYYPTVDGVPVTNGTIFAGYNVETGLEQFQASTTPPIDVQVLWDSTQYAAYCSQSSEALMGDVPAAVSFVKLPNSGGAPGDCKGWWSVGEDFVFGQLLTPPAWAWPPVPLENRGRKLAESSSSKGKEKA